MLKFLIVLFLIPLFSVAQPNKLKLINEYIEGEYKQGFNGNVLIAQKGEVIYHKALGFRNYPLRQPLDNSSVFELASVSKQFTAVGILLLKERGKLRLSDSLRMFFPKLTYSNITIYQLLTHTSGLPDYLDEMDKQWDHHKIAFNKDVIQFLSTHHPPLYFTPGSRYDYSNTGYVLLAGIIEKLTGQTYNAYMQENIFKPLGMDSTRVYNSRRSKKDTIPDYAYGYVFDNMTKTYVSPDSLKQDDFVYWLDGVTGDGTVNSTTADLSKWENALQHDKILTKDDQADMFSPHTLTDTAISRYYGYGVELVKDESGKFITHNGAWPGYSTALSHYDDGDYTIVVLSNDQFNAVSVSNALINLLNNKPVVTPYQHKEVILDEAALQRFVGKYSFPAQIEIFEKDGKLYRHLPGRNAALDVELKPESDTKVFYTNKTDIQLEFKFGAKDQVTDVFVINCGVKSKGLKTE